MLISNVYNLNISWLNDVEKNPVPDSAEKLIMSMRYGTPFGREVSKHFYFFDISAVSGYKNSGFYYAGQS